jgi:hypothetical protein
MTEQEFLSVLRRLMARLHLPIDCIEHKSYAITCDKIARVLWVGQGFNDVDTEVLRGQMKHYDNTGAFNFRGQYNDSTSFREDSGKNV